MKSPNIQKVALAGVAGTFAMTVIMLIGPVVGVPKMDMGEMLGTMNPMVAMPYMMGWIMHFVIGIILTYIYAAFLIDKLSSDGWRRGVIYSVIPYLIMQALLGPMMGMGFFFGGDLMAIAGALIAHLAYGGVMGLVYSDGGAATS